jgi:hypothetical protein
MILCSGQGSGFSCNIFSVLYKHSQELKLLIELLKDRRRRSEGEVNGSQSKFLDRTWPISQNQSDAPLF